MNEINAGTRPEPLVTSRFFQAPRETVFRAWSSAAHIKRWFSPEGLTVPEAEVDFRPGGKFIVCMEMPDGTRHWTRGAFGEITRPERLVFKGGASSGGVVLFSVVTTVTFAAENGGTRMSVHQAYEIFDPAAEAALRGAAEGWRTTLNRLAAEVDRLCAPAVHGSFTLERHFAAAPARVFMALTMIDAKNKWFAGGEGYAYRERSMDARPGGHEVAEGMWPDGTISRFDAVYFEVLADTRVVYAYEMHLNGERISVSLATLQLFPVDGGTRLEVTEQGVFVNGYDDNGSREHGTNFLLDKMLESLGGPAAVKSSARS